MEKGINNNFQSTTFVNCHDTRKLVKLKQHRNQEQPYNFEPHFYFDEGSKTQVDPTVALNIMIPFTIHWIWKKLCQKHQNNWSKWIEMGLNFDFEINKNILAMPYFWCTGFWRAQVWDLVLIPNLYYKNGDMYDPHSFSQDTGLWGVLHSISKTCPTHLHLNTSHTSCRHNSMHEKWELQLRSECPHLLCIVFCLQLVCCIHTIFLLVSSCFQSSQSISMGSSRRNFLK